MSNRRRSGFYPELIADVQALCLDMGALAAGRGEPELDTAGAVCRHGLDPLVDCLTELVWVVAAEVGHVRGDVVRADAVLDEYLRSHLFNRPTDELCDLVRRQVMDRCHPPIPDGAQQDAFICGLLALQVRAVIEMAAAPSLPTPVPPLGVDYQPPVHSMDASDRELSDDELHDRLCSVLRKQIAAEQKAVDESAVQEELTRIFEEATSSPSGPGRTPADTGRREIFEHVCTPECVPFHEHPGLGCRDVRTEIITRRRRRRG